MGVGVGVGVGLGIGAGVGVGVGVDVGVGTWNHVTEHKHAIPASEHIERLRLVKEQERIRTGTHGITAVRGQNIRNQPVEADDLGV